MTARTDEQLLTEAQRLLDGSASRLSNLRLTAMAVEREDYLVKILIRPSRPVCSEDYVHVLAAVESALDIGDDETVLLVPTVDEEAA